jgi:PAS domain S-box-containing protein
VHTEAAVAWRQQQREAEPAAPESLLRALDTMRAGFQVLGPDWRYRYVNPAAAMHGRRTVQELVGRSILEVYPGIEKTAMFETLQRAMRDRQSAAADNLFTFPDGESRWFEIRVEPVPEGVSVYSLDIHERKLQQLELERRVAELEATQTSLTRRLWRTVARSRLDEHPDGWIL